MSCFLDLGKIINWIILKLAFTLVEFVARYFGKDLDNENYDKKERSTTKIVIVATPTVL